MVPSIVVEILVGNRKEPCINNPTLFLFQNVYSLNAIPGVRDIYDDDAQRGHDESFPAEGQTAHNACPQAALYWRGTQAGVANGLQPCRTLPERLYATCIKEQRP